MRQVILSGENKGSTVDVRPMRIEEIKALEYGQRVLVFTGYFGRNRIDGLVHVKINGKPKTWKTRPDNVHVPIKYGLYEYETVRYETGAMVDPNLYFVVKEN